MNVEQEDIDLMAKLFDYAALSAEQERRAPPVMNSSTPRHRLEAASDLASNLGPQGIIMTSNNDSAAIETRQIRADPPAVPEDFDWPNEDFDIFPDFTNHWSFFGRPWSTYPPEGPA